VGGPASLAGSLLLISLDDSSSNGKVWAIGGCE